MSKGKRNIKIKGYLKNRYRLVIMDDDTFEEKASFGLSRINIYVLLTSIVIAVVSLTLTAIVATPLKEYIPGYADVDIRTNLTFMKIQVDSLDEELRERDLYLTSIRKVIEGEIDTSGMKEDVLENSMEEIDIQDISVEDSMLRAQMESDDNLRILLLGHKETGNNGIEGRYFFPPISGFVTSDFDTEASHYGLDVVAPENEPVKATLEGVVIQASWTLNYGHVIAIQHENELVSIYKHNSILLKKVGNFVRAGDVIAVVGSSGELSTGPHLHFELWHAGTPIDPKAYIVFN